MANGKWLFTKRTRTELEQDPVSFRHAQAFSSSPAVSRDRMLLEVLVHSKVEHRKGEHRSDQIALKAYIP